MLFQRYAVCSEPRGYRALRGAQPYLAPAAVRRAHREGAALRQVRAHASHRAAVHVRESQRRAGALGYGCAGVGG